VIFHCPVDYVMEETRHIQNEDNVSLNQLIATFVADGIGHRRAILSIRKRAERGDVGKAMDILSRVPDTKPVEGDAL